MQLTLAQCDRLAGMLRRVERDVEREGVNLDGDAVVRIGPAIDGGVVATVAVQVRGLPPVRLTSTHICRDGTADR